MVEGWEKETELRREATLCVCIELICQGWVFSTFHVTLIISCISGRFSQGCRTPAHHLWPRNSAYNKPLDAGRIFWRKKPLCCMLNMCSSWAICCWLQYEVKQRPVWPCVVQAQCVKHLASLGKESDFQEFYYHTCRQSPVVGWLYAGITQGAPFVTCCS